MYCMYVGMCVLYICTVCMYVSSLAQRLTQPPVQFVYKDRGIFCVQCGHGVKLPTDSIQCRC